jgi:hypothetical protein
LETINLVVGRPAHYRPISRARHLPPLSLTAAWCPRAPRAAPPCPAPAGRADPRPWPTGPRPLASSELEMAAAICSSPSPTSLPHSMVVTAAINGFEAADRSLPSPRCLSLSLLIKADRALSLSLHPSSLPFLVLSLSLSLSTPPTAGASPPRSARWSSLSRRARPWPPRRRAPSLLPGRPIPPPPPRRAPPCSQALAQGRR